MKRYIIRNNPPRRIHVGPLLGVASACSKKMLSISFCLIFYFISEGV